MSERKSSSGQGGPSSWQGNVVSGNARVQNGHHYGDATYNITYPGAQPPSLRDQILDSLWFDMMEARQDNIKGATPETLDGIYEPESSRRDDQYGTDSNSENSGSQVSSSEDLDEQDPIGGDGDEQDRYHEDPEIQDSSSEDQEGQYSDSDWAEQDQHREQAWDNFAEWLEGDDSIYWVCGKAGSGKSTLMVHIVDDDRTVDYLSRWAKEKPLHILKFFFWRPGTELQKSVTGLLRALLYQICDKVDTAIPKVINASRWNPGRQAAWSDKRLSSAIEAALTCSGDVFCFFLDGLDEFVGDLSTLTELVYQLGGLENVKICVSSRPEAELTANFSSCQQLRLERLNHADMKKFIKSQLHRLRHMPLFTATERKTYSDFVDQVVYRADGVFLWAVLVSPTLVRGISSGDDWQMLQNRLKMTPTEINDLYASMLAKLDPLHRESFYFYLELMKLAGDHGWTIAQVTAAQLGEDLLNMSYESFLQACDIEKLRINSRSVGLLQISELRDHSAADIGQCVAIPQLIAQHGSPSIRIWSARDAAKLRTAMLGSVPNVEAHIRAENGYLEWIHRSAHDFIFPADGSVAFACNSQSHRADVCQKFLLGGLNMLAVLPSFGATSGYRLTDLVEVTDRIMDSEFEFVTASKLAENIRLVVCGMQHEDFDRSGLPYANVLDRSLDVFPFWLGCFTSKAWSVVHALMPLLLSEPAGNALLMPLWNHILLRSFSTTREPPGWTAERVFIPFLKKIEDNIWLPGEASARVVLYFYGVKSAEGHDYVDAWHLSCTVPDSLGPRQPAAIRMFFEQYLSPGGLKGFLIAHLDRIAASLSLFSDIAMPRSKAGGMRTKQYRVLLQCSPTFKRSFRSDSLDSRVLPEYYNELRIICSPAGFPVRSTESQEFGEEIDQEINEYICLAPSSRTGLRIMRDMQQAVGEHRLIHFKLSDDAMLQTWTKMLVEDIWENAPGLDATQQLFALACVKWTVPRWLGCDIDLSL